MIQSKKHNCYPFLLKKWVTPTNTFSQCIMMRMCSLRLIEPFKEIEFPFSFEIKKFSNFLKM